MADGLLCTVSVNCRGLRRVFERAWSPRQPHRPVRPRWPRSAPACPSAVVRQAQRGADHGPEGGRQPSAARRTACARSADVPRSVRPRGRACTPRNRSTRRPTRTTPRSEHDDFRRGARDRDRAAATGSPATPIRSSRPDIAKMIGLKAVRDVRRPRARGSAPCWPRKPRVVVRPDEVLFREGEMGDEVFVLLSGEVSVLRRDDTVDRVGRRRRTRQRHRRARRARSGAAQRDRDRRLCRRADDAPVRQFVPAGDVCQSGGVRGYHSHAGAARSRSGSELETRRRSSLQRR